MSTAVALQMTFADVLKLRKKRSVDKRGAKSDEAYVRDVLVEGATELVAMAGCGTVLDAPVHDGAEKMYQPPIDRKAEEAA